MTMDTSPSDSRLPVLKTYKIYIGGKFPRSESGKYFPVKNRKGQPIANACQCSRKDFRDAVVAARAAQSSWASRSAYNRGQIPYRAAEMAELRRAELESELDRAGVKGAAREVDAAGVRVREGQSFSAALLALGVFPDVAVKMVEVGESTGALQEMLNSLSDFFDEEIETSLDRFVTLVEPILLIIMGIVIAGLLLALYMPLFNLSNAIR